MNRRRTIRHLRMSAITISIVLVLLALGQLPISNSPSYRSAIAANTPVTDATNVLQKQQTQACNCNELEQIVRRYIEVSIAGNDLDYLIPGMTTPKQYSDAGYDVYEGLIQAAMARSRGESTINPHFTGPKGFPNDCSSTLDTKNEKLSGCIWQGMAINEAVRQKFCEAHTPNLKVQQLRSFIEAERDGYRAEESYLLDEQDRLLDSCKFSQWTGTISITWDKSTDTEIPYTGAKSGKRTVHRLESTLAMFYLVNGIVIGWASPHITENYTDNYTEHPVCHGSMKGPKGTNTVTYNENKTIEASNDFFGGEASVNVDRNGAYRIWAKAPAGALYGTSHVHTELTGDCQKDPPPFDKESRWEGFGYAATDSGTGRVAPNESTLKGASTVEPKPMKLGATTISERLSLGWDLRRKP